MPLFSRLKRLLGSSPPAAGSPVSSAPSRPRPTWPPDPTVAHSLALYKYDSCPYCQRVMRALDPLNLGDIELRDTRQDPVHRRGLMEATGRTQVPCLFIDGQPLFESEDIVDWLTAYSAGGLQSSRT